MSMITSLLRASQLSSLIRTQQGGGGELSQLTLQSRLTTKMLKSEIKPKINRPDQA